MKSQIMLTICEKIVLRSNFFVFFQNIIAPVRTGYGFEQPPGPSFPVEPEPDYAPSVRLFINPVPSPDSKIQRMMR